eukprot:9260562-Pyramimonas_sp.AAC.1
MGMLRCLLQRLRVRVVQRRRLGFVSSFWGLDANFGHPRNGGVLRVLKHAHVSDAVVRAARGFKCFLCDGRRQPEL